MTKFIVKGTVKYKGVKYTTGSVVEVDKKDVAEFKKNGWEIVGEQQPATPPVPPTPPAPPAGEGKGQEEVVELTEEQIAKLFEEKPELAELTNAQLEALLEEKGVEFKKGAKKAILLALLV